MDGSERELGPLDFRSLPLFSDVKHQTEHKSVVMLQDLLEEMKSLTMHSKTKVLKLVDAARFT